MSEPKRLFFAIDLPDEARAQIIAWRAVHFASEDGRPVAAANLHLTLAFLGNVSNDKQRALAQLAGRIRQPCGGYPAAGLLLVIPGHVVCALRHFVWAGPHPLCRATALDAGRIIMKEFRCYSHPLYNALR